VDTALARLETRGLLVRERDARDGRRVVVWLTAAGRTLDVPTRGTVEAAIEAGLSTCSSEEIDVAHRVLEVLATALRDQHEIPEARTTEKPTRASVTRTKPRRR
jgi:DNA-binding MarR family transcriptional regulator